MSSKVNSRKYNEKKEGCMRQVLLLTAILGTCLIPLLAYAGPGSDGGAKSIVCYDESGALTQSTLLDLYEGKEIFGDVYPYLQKPVRGYLKVAVKRLKKTGFKLLIPNLNSIENSIDHVLNTYRLINSPIASIEDDFSLIEIPEGCKKIQSARFIDANNIVVRRDIWESMDNLNKAALILHEAVYWMSREETWKQDSRRSRRVVSQILENEWHFVDVTDGLPSAYTLCNSASSEAPQSTVFAVYPRKDNFQEIRFFAINGDFLIDKTFASTWNFPFIADPNDLTSYGTNVLLDSSSESQFKLNLYRDQVLRHDGSPAGSTLKMDVARTSYPTWEAKNIQIDCIPFKG